MEIYTNENNGRDSFQLFVGVFDTCLAWYLLVLPSETHCVANMTSQMAIDGNTSYHSSESFSLWFHLLELGSYNVEVTHLILLEVAPPVALNIVADKIWDFLFFLLRGSEKNRIMLKYFKTIGFENLSGFVSRKD